MPVHNAKCKNTSCSKFDEIVEVVVYKIGADMPSCEECGDTVSKTFALTPKDKVVAENNKRRRTQVRDPFLKPNTVPRRAFDKKSTPQDLADDLKSGDIFK